MTVPPHLSPSRIHILDCRFAYPRSSSVSLPSSQLRSHSPHSDTRHIPHIRHRRRHHRRALSIYREWTIRSDCAVFIDGAYAIGKGDAVAALMPMNVGLEGIMRALSLFRPANVFRTVRRITSSLRSSAYQGPGPVLRYFSRAMEPSS
jgi:hypothetical protein